MVAAPDQLSTAESDRIYREEMRPFHLGGVERSTNPTVVFIGGAPGSGKTRLVPQVAAKLSSGIPVVLSIDDLREYHPAWQQHARNDVHAAERFNADASRWLDRLYAEAISRGKNVVVQTGFRQPQLFQETVAQFRAAGYRAEAVILAVDADRIKRAVVGRFLDAQDKGRRPPFVTAARCEEGYTGLRITLRFAEDNHLLDQLRIVRRDGQELYRNTSNNAKWRNPPAAVAALDRERDRPQTPTELANNAIAWHQLSTRAQLNQKTPAVAIEQALRWRKEAAQRALAGPEAAKHYRSRLAGESFRTMPSDQFLREFPTYAGAVERLTSAARHASRQYTTAGDRDAFVLQARERLAQYIDDGRQFGRIEAREGTLAPSETRTRDNPRSR